MEFPLKPSSARQSILLHLKKSPRGLTVDDLSKLLGITPMAVRRHLGVLESAQLITSVVERRPKGRPANIYSLTESANDLFPSNYSSLLNVLLDCLEETSGPEMVSTIFSRWKDKLVAYARTRLDGLPFDEKVHKLKELLEAEGFMPDLEHPEPGVYVIQQHNCPILKVSSRYGEVCHFEHDVYREVLDAPVERMQRRVDGDYCCAYRITRPTGKEKAASTTADRSRSESRRGRQFDV
jgi:predicted ArsR family transcriptional regulator